MDQPIVPDPVKAPERTPWLSDSPLTRDALVIAGAILFSGIVISASLSTPGRALPPTNVPGAPEEEMAAAPEDTSAVTTLDDDPYLGDRTKAKVAIVEFSDYECPFCKKFHSDTFDKIVSDYVDSGKAVVAFRDFPLSFHDPKATEYAALASCIGKAKGNEAYFAFGGKLFAETQSNGQGLPAGRVETLIREAGLDPAAITACSKTEEVQQEIEADIAAGQDAGVSGTPSFVIGTLAADGTVTGERMVGALPYPQIQTIIDGYLE